MRRVTAPARPDWRARAEAIGFSFHTLDGAPYWDETAAYQFTTGEIEGFEEVTAELEQMCFQAVERVVTEKLYPRLAIPPAAQPLIEQSWARRHKNLYGRFDFSYDGENPPKLLEYNADTPTALFEASVVQWEWLQTVRPEADQFNSIHEKLIAAWPRLDLPGKVLHFTAVGEHAEDRGTVDYLRDTALQAGFEAPFVAIDRLGWNGSQFVDEDGAGLRALFKLYPWEWLMAEEFGQHLAASGLRILEPAWKMVLSNKGILPVLWDMYPDHPNLLPASFVEGALDGPVVRKPLLGREGANVRWSDGARSIETEGAYGAEGYVWQAAAPLPDMGGGNYPVIGSWVIASEPAGLGIREDSTPVTRNTSRFVPHWFE